MFVPPKMKYIEICYELSEFLIHLNDGIINMNNWWILAIVSESCDTFPWLGDPTFNSRWRISGPYSPATFPQAPENGEVLGLHFAIRIARIHWSTRCDSEVKCNQIWLVVSTPLKNISQLGLLFPIYGKNVPNHQPECIV